MVFKLICESVPWFQCNSISAFLNICEAVTKFLIQGKADLQHGLILQELIDNIKLMPATIVGHISAETTSGEGRSFVHKYGEIFDGMMKIRVLGSIRLHRQKTTWYGIGVGLGLRGRHQAEN